MLITVCVIAYNEEDTLEKLLEQIGSQDYDHSNMEIVLVNSNSTDQTNAIMHKFADNNCDGKYVFYKVQVLQNEKKTLPCGWNVALKSYSGEAILKIDAHATIPEDFVRKNVETLEQGEDIAGGFRPNMIDESTPWKETLLLAEGSMFGSSIAPYRRNQEKTYVKSMFHAVYRRKVFDKIGVFNENLERTEDNEIHFRMREAGYKLCFNPEIISYQHIRSNAKKMIKQKYANGYWIGLTSGICPKCLSLYHFVPFAFVLAIIITTVLSVILAMAQFSSASLSWLAIILYGITDFMWTIYWMLAVVMAMVAVIGANKKQRHITNIALPFLFFVLHVSYGIGTLIGVIKMPKWRKGIKNGTN